MEFKGLNQGISTVGILKMVRKNGKGEYTYQNGSTYKGTFENSCFKDGELTLKDEQGVFEIQIKDGKIEGKVKAELINGDSYKGNFANGKFNGECEITYSGGDTYIGTVKDDLKNGEGTYQWYRNRRFLYG